MKPIQLTPSLLFSKPISRENFIYFPSYPDQANNDSSSFYEDVWFSLVRTNWKYKKNEIKVLAISKKARAEETPKERWTEEEGEIQSILSTFIYFYSICH